MIENINSVWDQRNSTVGKVQALQIADPVLKPYIPYGPPRNTKVLNNTWVKIQVWLLSILGVGPKQNKKSGKSSTNGIEIIAIHS